VEAGSDLVVRGPEDLLVHNSVVFAQGSSVQLRGPFSTKHPFCETTGLNAV